MELHKRHYMIVKGIDKDKGIVYILDNMHVELGASTIYKDFMLDIRVLYDMAEAFRKNFESICNKGFFWSVGNRVNTNFKIDNENYFLRLRENILNTNKYLELNILDINSNCDISVQKYLSYANLRVVFYNSLIKHSSDDKIKEELANVLKEWNTIKLEMAFRDSYDVKEKVLKIIEKEKECLKRFEITDNKKLAYIESCNYQIINRKNATISRDENYINIKLDENEIYDIWGNADNGVIIIKEDTIRRCGAIMRINTEFGSSSHCGIYIEFENGRRWLFGSLGRLNMAVHAIDSSDKYELCMYQEVVEDKMYIEVKYDDEYCYFYSGSDKKCKYTLKLDSDIVKIGYFVKTWENCYCEVSIEDVN